MKRTLIFLVLMFATNIELAFADWPYMVTCPKITSVVEPAGSSATRDRFTYYSSRSNEPYPAKIFTGADIKNYNTFSCYYEVSDGTQVTAKFIMSKCQAMSGFDASGMCNNSDPEQCASICSY
ncbi:MAG: hypothetical protein DRQ48_02080 [Gammaproteobacteria bacterium]|nr:MAG: hypothetical protein DRQ58_03450 [Gammaproteobacteria bacterium]RKZ71885.1 MAG: hypothetical protein DRQ48_02080 [Gammaproteobacteria bacterium]